MLTLLKEACNQITADMWKQVIESTRKIIKEDKFDIMCDEEFIINLQDCSDDSDAESDDDLGCEPLSD